MRRVVKIGGSLLSRPNLRSDLTQWFDHQAIAENLVIVGGGELVESVRRNDQLRPGNQIDIHWKCVELLEQTRVQLASLLDWDVVLSSEELNRRVSIGFAIDRPTLVAVRSFYDRQTDIDVPLDWRTTSDTIAAILAVRVAADELVLLKSCKVDPLAAIEQLAACGIVDEAAPRIAQEIESIRVEQLKPN